MFTLSIVRGNGYGGIWQCNAVNCLSAEKFHKMATELLSYDKDKKNDDDRAFGQKMMNLIEKASKEPVNVDCYLCVYMERSDDVAYLRPGEKAYVMNEAGHTVAKYGCE